MTPEPLPATASLGRLLYQHELVLVGREWYANVQVGPWERTPAWKTCWPS